MKRFHAESKYQVVIIDTFTYGERTPSEITLCADQSKTLDSTIPKKLNLVYCLARFAETCFVHKHFCRVIKNVKDIW